MERILVIFVVGFSVLLVAILANIIAQQISLDTWHDVIVEIPEKGVASFFLRNIVSLLFLYLVYPLVLGGTAFFVMRWLG